MREGLPRDVLMAALILAGGFGVSEGRAETVMQQCGQQYQAAKAAGTLNGMTWNQFRSDCSTKLKAQPAATTTTTPVAAPATPVVQTANPLNPAPAAAPAPTPATTAGKATTPSAGRAAFVMREKQCGGEWRANKASLTAQTPGLTWPKYLSQCNARLKAAGKQG